MSEWIQCRICGNIWDCVLPSSPIFGTCCKCSDWSDEEKKEGKKHQASLRDEMYARLRKINEGEK